MGIGPSQRVKLQTNPLTHQIIERVPGHEIDRVQLTTDIPARHITYMSCPLSFPPYQYRIHNMPILPTYRSGRYGVDPRAVLRARPDIGISPDTPIISPTMAVYIFGELLSEPATEAWINEAFLSRLGANPLGFDDEKTGIERTKIHLAAVQATKKIDYLPYGRHTRLDGLIHIDVIASLRLSVDDEANKHRQAVLDAAKDAAASMGSVEFTGELHGR